MQFLKILNPGFTTLLSKGTGDPFRNRRHLYLNNKLIPDITPGLFIFIDVHSSFNDLAIILRDTVARFVKTAQNISHTFSSVKKSLLSTCFLQVMDCSMNVLLSRSP